MKVNTFFPVLSLFFTLAVNSKCFSEEDDESCFIRFYEGQYFKGNFWTLDSDGSWTSSRQSYFRRPYRNFGIKSIRMYGPDYCRWHVCPIRTRRNFHQPRWKKCRLAESAQGRNLNSLRKWGWNYYIIGNVIRLPDKEIRLEESNEDTERGLETPNRFFGIDESVESAKSFDGFEGDVCKINPNDIESNNGHFVPHYFDITKFYLCQQVGLSNRLLRWIPHLMECPQRTCFSMISKKCVWMTPDENDSECSIIKTVF